MAVYKRGAKGVFHVNFTVNGVRVNKGVDLYVAKEWLGHSGIQK